MQGMLGVNGGTVIIVSRLLELFVDDGLSPHGAASASHGRTTPAR